MVTVYSTYNKLGWGKGGKQNNPFWRDHLRSHNQKGFPFWPITGKLWSFIDCYCSSPMNVKRQSQIQPLQVPSTSIPSPKWEVSGRRDAFLLFFCLRWASQHKHLLDSWSCTAGIPSQKVSNQFKSEHPLSQNGNAAGAQQQRCKCSAPDEIKSLCCMNSCNWSGRFEAFKFNLYIFFLF